MRDLLPVERQMILAEVYHYAWYEDEAYIELQEFIEKWKVKCLTKAIFLNQIKENDATNTGA